MILLSLVVSQKAIIIVHRSCRLLFNLFSSKLKTVLQLSVEVLIWMNWFYFANTQHINTIFVTFVHNVSFIKTEEKNVFYALGWDFKWLCPVLSDFLSSFSLNVPIFNFLKLAAMKNYYNYSEVLLIKTNTKRWIYNWKCLKKNKNNCYVNKPHGRHLKQDDNYRRIEHGQTKINFSSG
jgi:hypothetical protein